MFFKTKVTDRSLKSVPFERAYQIYQQAYTQSVESQKYNNLEHHEHQVHALEQQYANEHEAPTEVSLSDQVSVKPVSTQVAIKVGQDAILEEFLERGLIAPNMQTHYMPQIMKLLGERWSNSCIDPKSKLVDGNLANNVLFKHFDSEWDRGLWLTLMLNSRSSWLKAQYRGEAKQFCSLVPLIPYSIKLIHNIPYSKWDRKTIHKVVNSKLANAMLADVTAAKDLTTAELLEIRDRGLIYKTGSKAGTLRNAESTYKLYDTRGTKLEGMPELAQVMLTQIWCAHPNNRTRYMILDPNNWDNIPNALVEAQVFKQPTQDNHYNDVDHQMPWD